MANREAVGQQFQQVLGRTATPAELDYLAKFLDEGSIQPYEVGQLLQATPEYQNTLLQKNLSQYGDVLRASDERILQQGADIAGAQAQSRFAGLGRPNSSAMAASVFGAQGQLAGNLAQQRQSALADFYGRGLQQNQGLSQAYGQNALERGYGLRDEARQNEWQMRHDRELFNLQRDAYGDYMNQANSLQRRRGLGSLGGAALGAGAGALLAAPTGGLSIGAGALLGGSFGSKLGGGLF